MNSKSKISTAQEKQIRKQVSKAGAIFWVAGVAVIFVAFFFRFYRLADHPLGMFFDPAINGLDATRLMQRGGPVIFFPTNGGREALFMYLLIPFIWLFGSIPFSMRVLTASISLLTVVFLFGWLADLDLWPERGKAIGDEPSNEATLKPRPNHLWLSTLAGLALATGYWHIAASRLGQRPILVPMLSVPLFWFFLKGWATGQRRWFVLSGLLMGLEGHTYSAGRLLPVILGLALLPEFLPQFRPPSQKLNYKQTFSNLLIFISVGAVIYLPMAWYLLTHPIQFSARAASVMIWNFLDTPADIAAELGRNLIRVAGFFCCAGNPNPIFGLPNYPGSSPILLPFLLIGLLIALKQGRTLFYRLILVWWVIGLLPSIAAIEAPHPWRMINAVVPTAILIALGLLHTFTWLTDQLIISNEQLTKAKEKNKHYAPRTRAKPPFGTHYALHTTHYALHLTFYILPITLLLLPLPNLFRAYFHDWTRLQVTQDIYDYGAVAIRDTILDHADPNVPIYLPLSRFGDSTLLYYLSGYFERQAVLAASPAETTLLISPEKNIADTTWVRLHDGKATLLPPLTQEGQHLLQQALTGPSARPIQTVTGGTAAYQVLLADDPTRFVEPLVDPLDVSFGPVRLAGATYSKIVDPAAPFPVTLFWQANSPMREEYEVLLRLVDDSRRTWGNGDARPTGWAYPTSFWQPGLDRIAAQQRIVMEPDQPEPGRYWLAVSIFDPALGKRLPLTTPGDSPDTFYLGPVKVPLAPSRPDLLQAFSGQPRVKFGGAIELIGFKIDTQAPVMGQPIPVTLLWRALAPPPVDYTVFVHLLDANGSLVAGNDTQPLGGRYPTTIWSAGEHILDIHNLPTPADLPPGQYQLAIGLYQQTTGERLPIDDLDGSEDLQGRLILKPAITLDHK